MFIGCINLDIGKRVLLTCIRPPVNYLPHYMKGMKDLTGWGETGEITYGFAFYASWSGFNVTINDISVIHATASRCTGGHNVKYKRTDALSLWHQQ